MQITDKDLQKFRERAETELQSNGAVGRLAWDAVVNALCNEVEELRKLRAPGNAAACAPMTLDEAIEHAESRANETPCGQAHAQLAGWLRELRDLRNAPGNAAAMREALEFAEDELWALGTFDSSKRVAAALAAPARNCDRPECRTEEGASATYIAEHPHEVEPDASTYGSWLLATAKGGAE